MWAQTEEKEFWLSWLNRYKTLKCLWDDEAKRTAGRATRYTAYLELAELAKTVNPNADVAFVRGRINAFRTCYRRELRKVQAARENGCNYEPQLFYYQALDFLNDSSDMFDLKNYSEPEEDTKPTDEAVERLSKIAAKRPNIDEKHDAIKKRLNECLSSSSNQPFGAAKQRLSNADTTDDCDDFTTKQSLIHSMSTTMHENVEYDILGKRIAAHFRNMTPSQRLIAEKIITDVCIYARMERLTLDSAFYVEPTATKIDGTQQEVDYDNPDTFIYT